MMKKSCNRVEGQSSTLNRIMNMKGTHSNIISSDKEDEVGADEEESGVHDGGFRLEKDAREDRLDEFRCVSESLVLDRNGDQ